MDGRWLAYGWPPLFLDWEVSVRLVTVVCILCLSLIVCRVRNSHDLMIRKALKRYLLKKHW